MSNTTISSSKPRAVLRAVRRGPGRGIQATSRTINFFAPPGNAPASPNFTAAQAGLGAEAGSAREGRRAAATTARGLRKWTEYTCAPSEITRVRVE